VHDFVPSLVKPSLCALCAEGPLAHERMGVVALVESVLIPLDVADITVEFTDGTAEIHDIQVRDALKPEPILNPLPETPAVKSVREALSKAEKPLTVVEITEVTRFPEDEVVNALRSLDVVTGASMPVTVCLRKNVPVSRPRRGLNERERRALGWV
jgi:hypothetical protein